MAAKLTAAQAFALWLQAHEPDVFNYLLAHAPAGAAGSPSMAGLSGLGDWSSVLTSLSSDLSSAVSDVGNYLSSSSGQASLNNVISQYLGSSATQSQGQVLQTQAQLAAAGQAPAPIGYTHTASGAVIPVYTGTVANNQIAAAVANGSAPAAYTVSGQPGYALTPALTSSLAPSNNTWIFIGLGALGFAYLAMRR